MLHHSAWNYPPDTKKLISVYCYADRVLRTKASGYFHITVSDLYQVSCRQLMMNFLEFKA